MFKDPFFGIVPEAIEEFPYEPGKAALLIIDMQRQYAHPDGGMGRLGREKGREDLLRYRFEAIKAIVPRIRSLQEVCRAAGVEVIYVRTAMLTQDGRDGIQALRSHRLVAPLYGREAEILEEVAPVGDEIVINKTSTSAFNSSQIDQILRNLGVEQLLVTGVVTNGCVELAARDAADLGYWVTAVSDACAASTPELHANALERMTDGGLVAAKTTEQVISMVRSNGE